MGGCYGWLLWVVAMCGCYVWLLWVVAMGGCYGWLLGRRALAEASEEKGQSCSGCYGWLLWVVAMGGCYVWFYVWLLCVVAGATGVGGSERRKLGQTFVDVIVQEELVADRRAPQLVPR